MKNIALFFLFAFTVSFSAFIPNSVTKTLTASDTSLSTAIGTGGVPQTQFMVNVWGKASGAVFTIGNTGCKASRSTATTRIYQNIELKNGGPYYFGRVKSDGDTVSLCFAVITADTTKLDTVQFTTGTGAP